MVAPTRTPAAGRCLNKNNNNNNNNTLTAARDYLLFAVVCTNYGSARVGKFYAESRRFAKETASLVVNSRPIERAR